MSDVTVDLDWDGELRFRARAGDARTPMDGDAEAAASPVELLVESVVGCAAIDVVHILRRGRGDLRSLEARASADRAEEDPRRLTRLEVHFRLRGDVDRRAAERAARLSFEKYCSCYHSLREDIELSYRVTVEGPSGDGG